MPWLTRAAAAVERERPAPARGGVVLGRPVPLHPRRDEQHAAEAAPAQERWRSRTRSGFSRSWKRTPSFTPAARPPSTSASAALRSLTSIGFSTSTCRPRSRRRDALLGVQARGAADHDEVHRAVREERPRSARTPGRRSGRPSPRPSRRSRPKKAAISRPGLARGAGVRVGDVAAADEADPQGHRSYRAPARTPARATLGPLLREGAGEDQQPVVEGGALPLARA